MSDTLAKEVAPLGIGVTVVAPGAFRTDFRGPASIKQPARLSGRESDARLVDQSLDSSPDVRPVLSASAATDPAPRALAVVVKVRKVSALRKQTFGFAPMTAFR